jgi:tungstate transport system ATP-binding protein
MLPLILENVSYTAGGRTLINDVSFEIGAGTRTVILGANGAGKSVLMRLCHGLLRPTSGRVTWYGASGTSGSGRQAMVFQRPVLLRRSALANVTYALKLAGLPAAESLRRAQVKLDVVGMAQLAAHPARVLSGGEQQRLALARAWALEPEVLFLDEPTANLDPHATRHIEAVINAIHESGTKIIMTTHSLGQARRLGDEILLMSGGQIAERAPVTEFFSAPQSEAAREFLSGELP